MKQQAVRIAALLLPLLLALAALGNAANTSESLADQKTLSEVEQAWLRENPALADIAAIAPERLDEILDKLAAIIASPDATRGGLVPLDDTSAGLLLLNPALLEAWHASPEASADLLELIRLAGGGAPRK
jgi:ABC-type glycerol-3-phosphate transport system substrate-binding protein